MDGLECSEIPFSQIDLGDRYDAALTVLIFRLSQQNKRIDLKKSPMNLVKQTREFHF